jgi:hypothetical protein
MCFSYDQGAAVVAGLALQQGDLHKLDDAEKIRKEIKEQEEVDQEGCDHRPQKVWIFPDC